MHKLLTALLLGTTMASVAAPAFADEPLAKRLGERLRDRVTDGDRDDRRDRNRERREERADRRDDRRDDRRYDERRHREEEQRRRWEEEQRRRAQAQRDYDRRYGYDRRDDWGGYGYRYGGTPWNRPWTPYGFGYNDQFTRDWVLRNFADRNRNGRISDKEWRRAQVAFYELADRNRDGYISRGEYDWALRVLRNNNGYGYRW